MAHLIVIGIVVAIQQVPLGGVGGAGGCGDGS